MLSREADSLDLDLSADLSLAAGEFVFGSFVPDGFSSLFDILGVLDDVTRYELFEVVVAS